MSESNVREILDPDKAYRRWRETDAIAALGSRPVGPMSLHEVAFLAGWHAAVDALMAAGEVLQDQVDG